MCGKLYVISENANEYTYLEATRACCNAGMNLLSVDTRYEHECIGKIVLDYSETVWTSGRKVLTDDEEVEWFWCSANKPMHNDTPWDIYDYEPDANKRRNCALLKLYKLDSETDDDTDTRVHSNMVRLVDMDCDEKNYKIICEADVKPKEKYDCKAPECLKCENSNIKQSKADYYTSFRKCCELGTQLLSIETTQELQCFVSINKENSSQKDEQFLDESGSEDDYYESSNNTEPLNFNHSWTSASNLLCKNSWHWCSPNLEIKNDVKNRLFDDEFEQTLTPNNCLNCAYITSPGSKLRNENCDKKYYFICEAPLNMMRFVQTTPSPELPVLQKMMKQKKQTTLPPTTTATLKVQTTTKPTKQAPPVKCKSGLVTTKSSRQKRATSRVSSPAKPLLTTILQTTRRSVKSPSVALTAATKASSRPSSKVKATETTTKYSYTTRAPAILQEVKTSTTPAALCTEVLDFSDQLRTKATLNTQYKMSDNKNQKVVPSNIYITTKPSLPVNINNKITQKPAQISAKTTKSY